jgi:glutamate transport system substrate-binding protein
MRIRLVAAMAAATLLLGACSSGADDTTDEATDGAADTTVADFPEGSTMAALAEAGTITVGTKFDQPLFGLVGPDGVPEGFDVEVAKLISAKLGIAPENINWVETISANREDFIERGEVDIVVATYTINDDRKERISFAGPYYEAGQSILTMSDNTTIQGPDDLAGTKVCTVSGSTPEATLLADFPETEVVPFGAYSECLEPLRNGQVDAVSTDNVILAGFAAESDDMEVRGEPFTQEPYGIGLTREDTEFRDWINDTLEELYSDGSWTAAWEETAGTVLPTPEPPAVDRYELNS